MSAKEIALLVFLLILLAIGGMVWRYRHAPHRAAAPIEYAENWFYRSA